MKNYSLILQSEENFARLVALGLWIKRPVSPWHYLLPGMFIFDYLRRSAMVKSYSAAFLFPRKLALDLSLRAMEGIQEKDLMFQKARRTVKEWLASYKLYSAEIEERHMEQINILMEHYIKLLKADGNEYSLLVKNSYGDINNYQNFVERITAAESYIDLAIANHMRNEEIKRRLEAERKQVAELRQKEMYKIFPVRF